MQFISVKNNLSRVPLNNTVSILFSKFRNIRGHSNLEEFAEFMMQPDNSRFVKIADLRPYLRGVNCQFIVLEKG